VTMSEHHDDDWTKSQRHASQRGVTEGTFRRRRPFSFTELIVLKRPFRNLLVRHGPPEQMARRLGFGSFRRFNCDLAIQWAALLQVMMEIACEATVIERFLRRSLEADYDTLNRWSQDFTRY